MQQVMLCNMLEELDAATKGGIIDRAGPIYQFSHDIVQQTVYGLILVDRQKLLHKTIGDALLKGVGDDPTIQLLAVDQINRCCKEEDGSLTPEERSKYAHANADAAKFAISASSFKQARSYINVGMKLLEAQHWQTQYALSLSLYEMSASVSFMRGDQNAISSCINEILSNAKSFDDSLKASVLLVRLLGSSLKFEKARKHCLKILSKLGEDLPSTTSVPRVLDKVSKIQTLLRNGITHKWIQQLPRMMEKNKINAMKFMNMLCMYSVLSKPLCLPLVSFRMVELTLQDGFCDDDSIVGLTTAAYSMIETCLISAPFCELLVEESPNKHALRSRLSNELVATLDAIVKPIQSVISRYPEMYKYSMLAGDVQSAVISRWHYCASRFVSGGVELFHLSKDFVLCIQEAEKYQMSIAIYAIMTHYNALLHLSGAVNDDIGLKTYDELDRIGERTKNAQLLLMVFLNRMSGHFWRREFFDVAQLSENTPTTTV